MKSYTLLLWIQVVLEDTVSEFFYTPLFVALVASVLAYFEVVPMPYEIFLSAALLLGFLFFLRSLWVLAFIKHSEPVIAYVGNRTGYFRKWAEHILHVQDQHGPFEAKHTFLKKEVSEGEIVLALVHRRQKRRVLIARRKFDKDSLVG